MSKQLPYKTIKEIFTRFQAAEPEAKGELEHVNAYTLVVAVALSAQATDKGVNKATRALFKIADTPQKMFELGEEGLIDHIKTIGRFFCHCTCRVAGFPAVAAVGDRGNCHCQLRLCG